jgi:4-amino-4-deoxy-L-arabinose transferase-like glycosyltransferase
VRFVLAWLLPTFITFCLVSGKQPHYLLPMFPAFGLLSAYLLADREVQSGRWGRLLPALILLIVGITVALLPSLGKAHMPSWIRELSAWWGVGIALVGLVLWLGPWRRAVQAVIPFSVSSMAVVLLFYGVFLQTAWPAYNVAPVAQLIARLQQRGLPVAVVGGYHNQFQFLGRLQKPLADLDAVQLGAWRQAHPDGRAVLRTSKKPDSSDSGLEYMHRFRSQWVSIWRVDHLCKDDGSCGKLWQVVAH